MDFHQNIQPEENDETLSVQEQDPVSKEPPVNDPDQQSPIDGEVYRHIPYENNVQQPDSTQARRLPYGSQAQSQNQSQAPNGNPAQAPNQIPYSSQVPPQNQNPYGNQVPPQNQNPYYGINGTHQNPYGNNGPYGNGYPPFQNNGYRQNVYPIRPAEPGSSLAQAAMVLGIIALICCFTFTIYPAFILGSIAILLALLSKGRRPALFPKARTAIICATIGLVLNTIFLTSAVVAVFTNDELRQEVNEIIESQYGMSFDELIDEIINGNDY